MKKIPTLYQRDPDDRRFVTTDVTPGCEWVLAGEGTPTRKFDGTCTMRDDAGRWWARREVKPGKTPPPGWRQVDHDETTGKRVGWEPIESSPFAKFHAEALPHLTRSHHGTYELIGPKINGNPESADEHRLVPHGSTHWTPEWVADQDDPIAALIERCRDEGWEGVVWHHPDGRMVKLKVRDLPEGWGR